jgi:hypothetical protein
VITPDNYEKKFKELREFLFGDIKHREEADQAGVKYDESQVLTSETINEETLITIVENIFRKAQLEKEYCIFYGKICENMIRLEVRLRDVEVTNKSMKDSAFRKKIFEVCKNCFEKFFDKEEKEKSKESLEKTNKFKDKLFGNLEFIGELYRRKILPESILVNVFQSLLGINTNDDSDDLTVEGAINLMNKVGEEFEKRTATSSKKGGSENKKEQFDLIFGTFGKFRDMKDENTVSNRIKILIKNLFTNKNDSWKKTKDINESGPLTKAALHKELAAE